MWAQAANVKLGERTITARGSSSHYSGLPAEMTSTQTIAALKRVSRMDTTVVLWIDERSWMSVQHESEAAAGDFAAEVARRMEAGR